MAGFKREDVQDMYFLTPMQEAMLFFSLLQPDSPAYFEQVSFSLKGRLNPQTFQAAWDWLHQQHQIFRTLFISEKVKRPMQVVLKHYSSPVHFLELGPDPEKLAEFLGQDRKQLFQPARQPPVRMSLLKLAADHYQVVWSFHHMLMDGWCLALVGREFFAAYQSFARGVAPNLPKATPYSAYVKWLDHQDHGAAADYWSSLLMDYETPIKLPSLGNTPSGMDVEQILDLGPQLTQALEALARQLKVTLNTLLQTAWGLVLQAVTHSSDVVFGSVVSGRPAELEGVDQMVGLFINSIPVRISAKPGQSLSQLIQTIQAQMFASQAWDFQPLASIQGSHPLKQDLIPHVLAFENFPVAQAFRNLMEGSDDLGLTPGEVKIFEQTNYAFNLVLVPGSSVQARFSFDPAIHDPALISELAASFQQILNAFTQNPHQKLEHLELLEPQKKALLLKRLCNESQRLPSTTLAHLFDQQLARTPQQLAVVFAEEQLSYQELDQMANQVARALLQQELPAGSVVGLLFPPGIRQLAAVLGVLRSDLIWVPLDPAAPVERTQWILADSRARLMLCTGLPDFVPEMPFLRWRQLPEPGPAVAIRSQPEHAAYLIYTSGSTGRPKGVMVQHGAIANTIQWRARAYAMGSEDRVLQLLNYVFDGFLTSAMTPLICGSSLIIASSEGIRDPELLRQTLISHQVSHFIAVPSLFSALIQNLSSQDLQSLRQVTLAGERVDGELVRRCRLLYPDLELINEYGPTENSVATTLYRPLRPGLIQPVGRAIDGVYLRILDRYNHQVPPYCPGEICIGGAGLALGYVGRIRQTASSFVPDPYSRKPGARLYRSGDLGYLLEDGNLVYSGRLDDQVKIRGYRIEPGEIENQLNSMPLVKQAVVQARTRGGQWELLAFVVSTLDQNALRQQCLADLPDYMLPQHFIFLEEMPLTTSGKLDRQALARVPLPDQQSGSGQTPQTPGAQALAAVWQEVLGIERVTLDQGFLELGGDSIKAIQVVSRLKKHGFRLHIRDLFENSGLEQVSQALLPLKGRANQEPLLGRMPLLPIQLWFFQQQFAEQHHWNQSVMLFCRKTPPVEKLRTAFQTLADYHDALRLVFPNPHTGHFRAPREVMVQLLPFDFRNHPEASREIEEKASLIQTKFRLDEGPLWQPAVFFVDEGCHILIAAHHLIIDTVSWGILIEDLATLLSGGQLPARTDSLATWLETQNSWRKGQAARRERSLWQESGSVPIRPLVREGDGPNLFGHRTSVSFELDALETRQLLTQSHPHGARIDELLICAYALAVSRWSGQSQLAIELEGHGREELDREVDLSRTLGWFTTRIPLVLMLSASDSPQANLQAVLRELHRIPNKGIGFGILHYLDQPFRPVLEPELAFNYLGDTDSPGGGMFEPSPISPGPGTSPKAEMPHLLSLIGQISAGRFRAEFVFASGIWSHATIEKLAESFGHQLRILLKPDPVQRQTRPEVRFPAGRPEPQQLESIFRQYQHIEMIYPLSPMQEGLLFHSLLQPDQPAYFEQFSFELEGELDPQLFQQSFTWLINRYPILRTRFQHQLKRPMQIVLRDSPADVCFRDFSDQDPETQKQSVAQFRIQDRQAGFDLAQQTLMRLALLKLAPGRHRVVWSFHHILMDGWCLGPISQDFFAAYRAFQQGSPPPQNQPPAYHSYISWLQNQDWDQARSWWQNTLSGYNQHNGLPGQTRAGGQYHQEGVLFQLDETLTVNLEQLAGRQRVTLSTLIRCLWGLLLQRYNNSDDVVFGAVISGRPAQIDGIEEMVGLFINSVPVRVRCQEGQTSAALLQQLGQQALEADRFAYFPLAEIQADSPLKGHLFDHIMVFENYPAEDTPAPEGFGLSDADLFEQSNYNLNIAVIPDSRITLKLSFNALVYPRPLMERIGGHFTQLATNLIQAELGPVNQLDLLSGKEREQQLYLFNQTEVLHQPQVLHRLFEDLAQAAPDRPMLYFQDQILTRGQLDRAANRLAHLLREKGVAPNCVVGLMVERSLEMVIGLLAIFKAGGAYLPLDASFPSDRIQFMLDESQAVLLLTNIPHDQPFPSLQMAEARDYPDHPLENWNQLGDLAYIIYTSGSTGLPKGVMIEHRNVVNLRLFFQKELGISEKDCAIQFAPFTFDASAGEILISLTLGVPLHILPGSIITNFALFTQYLNRHKVSFSAFPPPYLTHLDPESFPHLKQLMSAGSTPPPALFERWKNVVSFINGYGPTETTIICTAWNSAHQQLNGEALPIGRPVCNTHAYIMDDHRRLLPLGMVGELCIAGAGVSRGYVNQPQLTSLRFVANPHVPGEILYCTGDLAKFLPDGNLLFVGRRDNQVKIRGFRIEMGEVEHALLKNPAVQQAVVIDLLDSSGNAFLSAYAVCNQPQSTAQLDQWLRQQLPEFMVPDAIQILDQIPLTANGKVDRQALPQPQFQDRSVVFEAPSDAVEQQIQEIWQEVLNQDQIGVLDNFLELGGHSIKAIAITSRISDLFQVSLPLAELFRNPTIRATAEYIRNTARHSGPALVPAADREFYPLSFQQHRLFVLNRIEGGASYNMPGLMRVEGQLDADRLEAAFQTLIQRHQSLRTAYLLVDGNPVQQVLEQVAFKLGQMQISESALEKTVTAFIRPFDLSRPPLLRASLATSQSGATWLLFDIHHICSDGRSLQILLRELLAAYAEQELPPLSVQYRDYAVWQREQLAEILEREQEPFWLDQLSGQLPVLDLPLDYARPAYQSFAGDHLSLYADEQQTRHLENFARQSGNTLFTLLLAAYNVLLSKYSAQQDILVGSPVSGRQRVALEGLIGMFANTLILRNQPLADLCFNQFLEQVRNRSLAAFEQADLPFERLLEKLDLKRDLSRNPLFDTLFTVQEMGVPRIETGDLVLTPQDAAHKAAKFDLSLDVVLEGPHLHTGWEYCTALFSRQTMERMGHHLLHLLEQLLSAPDVPLSQISLLTQAEKAQFLTQLEYEPQELEPAHLTIAHQAELAPERTAVISGERQLTYRGLMERVAHIAAHLHQVGAQPQELVGLMVGRHLDMLPSLLAILSAGCAYVPIDPDYPQGRINQILEDSRVSLVVTENRFRSMLPADMRTLNLDEDLNRSLTPLKPLQVAPQQAAYVIYTSGSTGRPKGVQIVHEGLSWFNHALVKVIDFSAEKTILALTTLSFDIFVLENIVPLMNGMTIVLASEKQQKDPVLLAALIRERRVQMLQATPSRLKLLAANDPSLSCLSGLSELMTGGEALPPDLLQLLQQVTPARIYNLYGPTEVTVWSMVRDLTEEKTVTIGYPITGCGAHVVDAWGQFQPDGLYGELYLTGPQLARGYYGSPEKTAERFVAFAGQRAYRTGDLVRRLPNGDMQFAGRIDNQVKVRGFRVELGEIEACASGHPAVAEAVAVVRLDGEGNGYLCLWYREESPFNAEQLRVYLAGLLPEYMVPQFIAAIDQIPLTPSGKANRNALPDPSQLQSQSYVAPRNPLEQAMAGIWAELFHKERIGIEEDFFQLGGHSLTAIRFMSRMEELDSGLSMADLFRHRTISGLAAHLAASSANRRSGDQALARAWWREQLGAETSLLKLDLAERSLMVLFTEKEVFASGRPMPLKEFSQNFEPQLWPHYILPMGRHNREKAADLQQFYKHHKLALPGLIQGPRLLRRLAGEVEDLATDLLADMGPVQETYELSAVQRIELAKPFHGAGFILALDAFIDRQLLEKAILQLIADQEQLRVFWHRDQWHLHQPPSRISLPYLDLSEYNPAFRERVIEKVLMKKLTFDEGELPYSFVLIRENLREHLLYCSIDHAIYDALSGDIIRRNIQLYYQAQSQDQPLSLEKPNPYSNYVRHLSAGPKDLPPEDLIRIFNLEAYRTTCDKLKSLPRARVALRFESEIELEGAGEQEQIWEISYALFIGYCRELLQIGQVPHRVYSYGRQYGSQSWYHSVGAFYDRIPLVTPAGMRDSAAMARLARERLDHAASYQVNFNTLLYGQTPTYDNSRIRTLLHAGSRGFDDFYLDFNFQGAMHPRELAEIRKLQTMAEAKAGGPPPARDQGLSCQVSYSGSKLVFTIINSLVDDLGLNRMVFKRVADQFQQLRKGT